MRELDYRNKVVNVAKTYIGYNEANAQDDIIIKKYNMINSGAFAYVDLLKSSADYSWTRNEIISSNIANVDTPNYKRKDINFESILQAELSGDNLSEAVLELNQDLSVLEPNVFTDNASLSYRLDGNNVDIATEEAYLAENQIKYQALVDLMNQEFSRYKTVLSSNN